ncbi:FtsH protease activity modulator HflK [Blochmannia endosymbiont of Polyrhachis (Hedomyrma) turneri]|uniref:FtsH protease activity modulator HflK n=1 Tax=Blochmannia endosymbiont of Polyrhachis (Hedomyrma) turneri TaxID=1505596 RepID=UPI00061A7FC4|nr:Modulator of FtsH protease HflK [Blochmannia endosymbiont of Polyrhachis (Hedomyrma) turneri]
MWDDVYCYKYDFDTLKLIEHSSSSNCISHTKQNRYKLYFLDFIEKFLYKLDHAVKLFNNRGIGSNKMPGKKYYFVVSIFIIVCVLVWIGSGLYTIKEAERGVVLRFGKFHHVVQPGLNWRPVFFDIVIPVNVESVRELAASGMMLTSDENVVRVEMNVQYRITEPERYLFSVTNADYSLRQATDSALRGVIGKYTMDLILTEGRTVVRSDTRRVLESTIYPYNMGITLLDVNFQTARPPEEVKAAFDDAIAARENEQQYIREAEAYSNEVKPRANGQAQRILEEGRAYKARTVLEAQGEVQRFSKILPEYKLAPKITRERLYINTMERVLSQNQKFLISDKGNNNLLLIPANRIDRVNNHRKDVQYGNSDGNINGVLSVFSGDDNVVANDISRSSPSSINLDSSLMNHRKISEKNHDMVVARGNRGK